MKLFHRIAGVAAVVVTALALSAGSASASTCAPSGSVIKHHWGDLYVYQHTNSSGYGLYACSTYYYRRIWLDNNPSSAGAAPYLDIAKRSGYKVFAFAIYNLFGSVNLQTGATIRRTRATKYGIFYDRGDALVVKPNGSIGFIYSGNYGNSHSATSTVGKDDATGANNNLYEDCPICGSGPGGTGTSIWSNSLQWSGYYLYWKTEDYSSDTGTTTYTWHSAVFY